MKNHAAKVRPFYNKSIEEALKNAISDAIILNF
jgi:hypothetical protein